MEPNLCCLAARHCVVLCTLAGHHRNAKAHGLDGSEGRHPTSREGSSPSTLLATGQCTKYLQHAPAETHWVQQACHDGSSQVEVLSAAKLVQGRLTRLVHLGSKPLSQFDSGALCAAARWWSCLQTGELRCECWIAASRHQQQAAKQTGAYLVWSVHVVEALQQGTISASYSNFSQHGAAVAAACLAGDPYILSAEAGCAAFPAQNRSCSAGWPRLHQHAPWLRLPAAQLKSLLELCANLSTAMSCADCIACTIWCVYRAAFASAVTSC